MVTERSAHVTLYDGAELVIVQRLRAPRRPGSTARGDRLPTRVFTRRQRSAFLRALAMVNTSAYCLFITLTWPTWAAPAGRDWQRPWDRFRMRLARAHPDACGFYKRELTRAGVVHLHLLLYGATWSAMREFIPAAWADSVDAPDRELRERVGTQVAVVRRSGSVRGYASKYINKGVMGTTDGDPTGPWWGHFNQACIPTATPVDVAVSDDVAVALIRAVRRLFNASRRAKGWAPLRRHAFHSITVYGDPADWRHLAAVYGAYADGRPCIAAPARGALGGLVARPGGIG